MIVLSESASGLMATKMMLKERRGCATQLEPLREALRVHALRGLHSQARGTGDWARARRRYVQTAPATPAGPPAQRSHREGAVADQGCLWRATGCACTIACRRVRHWRMAAGIATVCACPRASTR